MAKSGHATLQRPTTSGSRPMAASIENALRAYQDYVDLGEEVGRVRKVIQETSGPEVQAINS